MHGVLLDTITALLDPRRAVPRVRIISTGIEIEFLATVSLPQRLGSNKNPVHERGCSLMSESHETLLLLSFFTFLLWTWMNQSPL